MGVDGRQRGGRGGYELWMAATRTGSTCQLVFWDSRGLVCLPAPLSHSLCERVCECVRPSSRGLSPPPPPPHPPHSPSPLHPLFLPRLHPSPQSVPLRPTSRHCSIHYPPPCTCDWKTHSQTLLAFSRSLRPPGSYSITEKKAEISYRRYTCAWCECQILSQ